MVNMWLEFIQSLVYPPACTLCGSTRELLRNMDLCRACAEDLPWISHSCRRCSLPLPATSAGVDLCGSCQKRPPPFDRCLAPLRYTPPVSSLISALKYGHQLRHSRLLGHLLADEITATRAPLPEIILPVPLHAQRMRERGFNQATEIARSVSHHLGIALDRRRLRRMRPTESQTGLDRQGRQKNLRKAFEVRNDLNARHVAVLDDVVTTGSTASEITRVLKKAGVAEVSIWAVARTDR